MILNRDILANALLMGMAGRPHGLKGEIGVDWFGEYQPAKGDNLILATGDGIQAFQLFASRAHKGRLLLTLEGIADRTQAEKLTGAKIFMSRDSLPRPDADEAFLEDLPGSKIFLADGSELGSLAHLDFSGGQVIWAIKDKDNREILFPAQPCFIKNMDLDKHEIIIDPPEGLLDIYLA